MKKAVAGILVLSLAGCGGFGKSRWNPQNWFGRGAPEVVAVDPQEVSDPALSDTRPMVTEVTSLVVERATGGAIVRATGLAPGPGYWGGELVPLAGETPVGGALVYFFRVSPPETASATGPRQLGAARFIANSALDGARAVIVRGATNQRRSGR